MSGKKKVLVDADIIAYRAAFSAKNDSAEKARDKVDDICSSITYDCFYPEGYTLNKDACLLYTSPSPRDGLLSRMPSSA